MLWHFVKQIGHKEIRREPGHAFRSKSSLLVTGMGTPPLDYEKLFAVLGVDSASIFGPAGGVELFQLLQDEDLNAVAVDSGSFLVDT